MSNFKKYYLFTVLYNVAFLFCSGSIIQTFLLELGISEHNVYIYSSITYFTQIGVMFLMIFLSNKIKHTKILMAFTTLPICIMVIVMLLCAINPNNLSKDVIVIVFISSAVANLGIGLRHVIGYCLPYKVIKMKEYGKLASGGVLLSGITSFIFSSLFTFFIAKYDYMVVMIIVFILSLFCFICSSVFTILLKEQESCEVVKQETDLLEVFKNKKTYLLILPNLARGIATGIVSVITVIAISKNILNEKTSSYINIENQIAMFLGNGFYLLFYKKLSTKKILLISTIGVSLALPFLLVYEMIWFLAFYFIGYFFLMIMDTAIPVTITEIFPESQIGSISSIRMLIFTGGQAIITLILSLLIDFIGYNGILVLAGVMYFLCGLTYYVVAQKSKSLI